MNAPHRGSDAGRPSRDGNRRSSADHIVQAWLEDPESAADQTRVRLELTHVIAAPFVVLAWSLVGGLGAGIVALGACYAGLLGLVFLLTRGQTRTALLGCVDLATLGVVVTLFPELFPAALVAAVAATSIGWAVSTRWATLLTGIAIASMTAGAVAGGVENLTISLLTFGGILALMSINVARVFAERRRAINRIGGLLDSLPVMAWESDGFEGSVRWVGGRTLDLLGVPATHLRGSELWSLVHPDDLTALEAEVRTGAGASAALQMQLRLMHSEGHWVPVRSMFHITSGGRRPIVRGVAMGIAAEVQAMEAIDEHETIVERLSDALVVVDHEKGGDPVSGRWNPAFHTMFGLGDDARPGRPMRELLDVLDDDFHAVISHVIDLDLPDHDGSTSFVRGDGEYAEVDFAVFRLGETSVGVRFTDVTDHAMALAQMRHQASHDSLTGLANRAALLERLDDLLALADHHNRVGLLLLDLDHFKEVNDTLGHQWGDDLLRVLARRLEQLETLDMVARLGGDEFAFLLAPPTSPARLDEAADAIVATLQDPIQLAGLILQVSPSIGAVLAPDHGIDAERLLQRADVAMYDAKRSASTWRVYRDTTDRHSVARLALTSDLRGLFERDELQLWFQPKIDLASGRVAGVEALARWNHPDQGLLLPDDFIELLELSGQIADLTWLALDQAVGALAGWDEGLTTAINVAARNLHDTHLPERVLARLEASGVDPSRLIVEITEREIMEDSEIVRQVLKQLHVHGIQISIDDFGTGYSSLSYLRRLPVSEIKVDRSFVQGITTNRDDLVLARALIDLAHDLGHRVVAEGVEDEDTLGRLIELGCDAAQGYYWSSPVPAWDLAERIVAIDSHARPAARPIRRSRSVR